MSLHFNVYSIALLMSGVTTLLISLIVLDRPISAVKWFALMMLCSAIWAICYSLELSSFTQGEMMFWTKMEYIGISFIPPTWIIFIFKFTGRNAWLTTRTLVVIFSFACLAFFFSWTNSWHHLYYTEVSLDQSGPFPLLSLTPGVWYYVHTIYFYFLLAWGVFVVFRKFRKSDAVYKKQYISILVGALIPWLVNVVYLFGLRPYKHIDLTPYAFLLTSTVIGFSLLKFKLFDVVPLAHEKLVNGIQEGILVLDSEGRVVEQNAPMEKFLRQYAHSIVGVQFDQIIPMEHQLHRLITRRTSDNLDVKLKDKDGDLYFEVAIIPLFENNESFSGTLLIFWDITERKQAEEKLKKHAEEMVMLNQLKDQLFSIISHDIRGPMATLKGLLSIAQKGNLSAAEFQNLLPSLSKNVGYTSELLENLLQWSRSQFHGETIHPENVNIKSLTLEKLLLFERRAMDKDLTLNCLIPEGMLVLADVNMIGVVLQNLIGNAIKFCDEGDSVTVSASHDVSGTTITVADTGIGIEPDKLARLFELMVTTTRGTHGEKGTGLGLKLCKDFVEKNDGEIWADSTPGKGSRFHFRLKNAILQKAAV